MVWGEGCRTDTTYSRGLPEQIDPLQRNARWNFALCVGDIPGTCHSHLLSYQLRRKITTNHHYNISRIQYGHRRVFFFPACRRREYNSVSRHTELHMLTENAGPRLFLPHPYYFPSRTTCHTNMQSKAHLHKIFIRRRWPWWQNW
jgi:hypothetical protein